MKTKSKTEITKVKYDDSLLKGSFSYKSHYTKLSNDTLEIEMINLFSLRQLSGQF